MCVGLVSALGLTPQSPFVQGSMEGGRAEKGLMANPRTRRQQESRLHCEFLSQSKEGHLFQSQLQSPMPPWTRAVVLLDMFIFQEPREQGPESTRWKLEGGGTLKLTRDSSSETVLKKSVSFCSFSISRLIALWSKNMFCIF